MKEFFELMGSLICHQQPSRTLLAGGVLLPVCARDMGIYTGIFSSALYLMMLRRMRARRPPAIAAAIIMCMLMLPMIVDGVLSYAGVIETNNLVRLFTGLFFGLQIPFLLVPAAHYSVTEQNETAVLKNIPELLPAYAIGLCLCVLLWNDKVPYFVAGMIYISGLLFLLSRITYTILVRMRKYRQKMLCAMTAAGVFGILMFLYLLSSFVLQPIKEILLMG